MSALGPIWGTALAVLLYLIPVAVVLAHRRGQHDDARALELAVLLPVAVAVDLLSIMAAALVVRLEVAVLVSRPIWIAVGLALWWRSRGTGSVGVTVTTGPVEQTGPVPVWPAVALASLGLVVLSLILSRPFALWDRAWHVPLVASLRGQSLPFANVFEPGRVLHYHFSGDVLAVTLQVLSGLTMHASRALSIAHDLMFALMGASAALLMQGLGRGVLASVLVPWAVVLAGPFTLISLDGRYPFGGYSFLSHVTMSFRPHVAVFGLLAIGVCAALLDRPRTQVRSLVLLFALLGMTDEVSAALFGVALAVGWLIQPDLLHRQRRQGLLVLGLLALAILLPNLVFRGSLSPGGPASALELVPPRAPGYGHPLLSLGTARGMAALLLDLLPTLALLAALLVHNLRKRAPAGLVLVSATLVMLGVFGLTTLQVNHTKVESHRFITAAVLFLPVLAFALVQGRLAWGLAGAGGALAAVSTLAWMLVGAPVECRGFRDAGVYGVNCRESVGAHFGERPAPTYVSPALWPVYAGCRPVYAAGAAPARQWSMKVLGPALGPATLAEITAMPRTGPLSVVCGPGQTDDPICAAARAGTCAAAGAAAEVCHLHR